MWRETSALHALILQKTLEASFGHLLRGYMQVIHPWGQVWLSVYNTTFTRAFFSSSVRAKDTPQPFQIDAIGRDDVTSTFMETKSKELFGQMEGIRQMSW